MGELWFMGPLFWLIVMAVMVIVEIITVGLTSIWFAGGALIAFFASLFGAPVAVQIVLFIIVSILTLALFRPKAVEHFNKTRTKTNVDSMIGKRVKVVEPVSNLDGTGTVLLNDVEWTARSASGQNIEKDSIVVVKEVKGVKLIVEKEN